MSPAAPTRRFAHLAALLGAVFLTGCVPTAPTLEGATSTQPAVDAAVVATDASFTGALTLLDDEGVCTTTITATGYGASAAMLDEPIELLRDGAATAGCAPRLQIVREDGTVFDLSHIPQYLDVTWDEPYLVL